MALVKTSFAVPEREKLLMSTGLVSSAWNWFFRGIAGRLYPLGEEQGFEILNNQAVAVDLEGLKFNKEAVSQATIDYYLVRSTTGTGAIQFVSTGYLLVYYKPQTDEFSLITENYGSSSGVVFSITAGGQVQYTSTNEGGTPSISKIVCRTRTLSGKNYQYSKIGRR